MTDHDDAPFTPSLSYAEALATFATHGRKLTSHEYDAFCGAEDDTRIFYHDVHWSEGDDVGEANEAYFRNGDDDKIEVYRLGDMACAFAGHPDEPWDTY